VRLRGLLAPAALATVIGLTLASLPELRANTSEWVGVVAHIELKFNGIGCSPGY
jgi:hypothetical protein